MWDVLGITGPIYLVMATGYLATRRGVIAREHLPAFGSFVLRFALPCLLFTALATRRISQIVDPTYLAAYALGALTMVALALASARRLLTTDRTGAAYAAMGVSCPNSAFIGYPVMLLTLPDVAGVVLGLNVLVENLVLVPLVLALAERGRGTGSGIRAIGRALSRTLANPVVVAIAAGLVVSLAELPVPAALETAIGLFAGASGGVALFFVGGLLVGLPVGHLMRKVGLLAAGKLLVQPLVVFAALSALVAAGMPALPPDLRAGLLITAALPMFSVYPVYASRHGHGQLASAALLGTTVLSFATLNVLLLFLRP